MSNFFGSNKQSNYSYTFNMTAVSHPMETTGYINTNPYHVQDSFIQDKLEYLNKLDQAQNKRSLQNTKITLKGEDLASTDGEILNLEGLKRVKKIQKVSSVEPNTLEQSSFMMTKRTNEVKDLQVPTKKEPLVKSEDINSSLKQNLNQPNAQAKIHNTFVDQCSEQEQNIEVLGGQSQSTYQKHQLSFNNIHLDQDLVSDHSYELSTGNLQDHQANIEQVYHELLEDFNKYSFKVLDKACHTFYKYYYLFCAYSIEIDSLLPAQVNLYQNFYEQRKASKFLIPNFLQTEINLDPRALLNPQYKGAINSNEYGLFNQAVSNYVYSDLNEHTANEVESTFAVDLERDLESSEQLIGDFESNLSLQHNGVYSPFTYEQGYENGDEPELDRDNLQEQKLRNCLIAQSIAKKNFDAISLVNDNWEELPSFDKLLHGTFNQEYKNVEYSFVSNILLQRDQLAFTYGSFDMQEVAKIYMKYLLAHEHNYKNYARMISVSAQGLESFKQVLTQLDQCIKTNYPLIFHHEQTEDPKFELDTAKNLAKNSFMARNYCLKAFLNCLQHSSNEFIALMNQEYTPVFDYVCEDLFIRFKQDSLVSKAEENEDHLLINTLLESKLSFNNIAYYSGITMRSLNHYLMDQYKKRGLKYDLNLNLKKNLDSSLADHVDLFSIPILEKAELSKLLSDRLDPVILQEKGNFKEKDSLQEILKKFEVLYSFFISQNTKLLNSALWSSLLNKKNRLKLDKKHTKAENTQFTPKSNEHLFLDQNKKKDPLVQLNEDESKVNYYIQTQPQLLQVFKEFIYESKKQRQKAEKKLAAKAYKVNDLTKIHSKEQAQEILGDDYNAFVEFVNRIDVLYQDKTPLLYKVEDLSNQDYLKLRVQLKQLANIELIDLFNPKELKLKDTPEQCLKMQALAYRLTNIQQIQSYLDLIFGLNHFSQNKQDMNSILLDESNIIHDLLNQVQTSSCNSLSKFFDLLIKSDLNRAKRLKDIISKVQGQLIIALSYYQLEPLAQKGNLAFKFSNLNYDLRGNIIRQDKVQLDLSLLIKNHTDLVYFVNLFTLPLRNHAPNEFLVLKNTQIIYSQLVLLIESLNRFYNWYRKISLKERNSIFHWYINHGNLFCIQNLIQDLKRACEYVDHKALNEEDKVFTLKDLIKYPRAQSIFDLMVRMYINFLKYHNLLTVKKVVFKSDGTVFTPEYIEQQLSKLYRAFRDRNQERAEYLRLFIVSSELETLNPNHVVARILFMNKEFTIGEFRKEKAYFKQLINDHLKVFSNTLDFISSDSSISTSALFNLLKKHNFTAEQVLNCFDGVNVLFLKHNPVILKLLCKLVPNDNKPKLRSVAAQLVFISQYLRVVAHSDLMLTKNSSEQDNLLSSGFELNQDLDPEYKADKSQIIYGCNFNDPDLKCLSSGALKQSEFSYGTHSPRTQDNVIFSPAIIDRINKDHILMIFSRLKKSTFTTAENEGLSDHEQATNVEQYLKKKAENTKATKDKEVMSSLTLEGLCSKRFSKKDLEQHSKNIKTTDLKNTNLTVSQAKALDQLFIEMFKIKQRVCYDISGGAFFLNYLQDDNAHDFYNYQQDYMQAYKVLEANFKPQSPDEPFNLKAYLSLTDLQRSKLFQEEIKKHQEFLQQEVYKHDREEQSSIVLEDGSLRDNFFKLCIKEKLLNQDIDQLLLENQYQKCSTNVYRFSNNTSYQGGMKLFLIIGIYNFVKHLYEGYNLGSFEDFIPLNVVLNGFEALEKQEAFFYKCSCGNFQSVFNMMSFGEETEQNCICCDQFFDL